METETLWLLVRSTVSLVALGTMVAFMMQRNIKQYRETKRFNMARMLMALSFIFSILSHVLKIGLYGLQINALDGWIGEGIQQFTANTVFTGLTIVFSATFAAYINGERFEAFVLFPGMIFIGAFLIQILVPEITFMMYFIMTFGVISMIALFEAGIRLKDNMALGIGIMSLFQFIASFFSLYISTALSMTSVVFAAITIAGLFRPFGKQEV
jgi:hypothetical protein